MIGGHFKNESDSENEDNTQVLSNRYDDLENLSENILHASSSTMRCDSMFRNSKDYIPQHVCGYWQYINITNANL